MNLNTLITILSEKGCNKIYVKRLAPNDNSKNQVYFGGSYDILNILPIQEVVSDDSGDWSKTRFKSRLDFYWVDEEGLLTKAPDSQLILYPKYPEVRFSGFLNKSNGAPSELMASRIDRRLLFLGVTNDDKIIGHVVHPDSEISREFDKLEGLQSVGIFKEITIEGNRIELDSRNRLITELKRINQLGWINSKRLDVNYQLQACQSSNCGGYTLEAELNIPSNPIAKPDFLGWEVKQFSVNNFERISSTVITLMDHSPTSGYFNQYGAEEFIRKYGYADKRGREARFNFGGTHKYNIKHKLTSLKLILEGYDQTEKKIINSNGYMALVDDNNDIAASWSFTSIIKHWNQKHSKACYIPSRLRINDAANNIQQYCYGNKIILGTMTDVSLFLDQVSTRTVYYDPAIKFEMAIPEIRKQSIKVRSLFRVKSGNLSFLYKNNEVLDLYNIAL